MSDESNQEKLYAGKYKTIEELEEGYKNSAKVFEENRHLQEEVKKYQTPDDYIVPEDIKLSEITLSDLKSKAKDMQLAQFHFERMVQDEQNRINSIEQKFNATKAELGEAKVNVINDYIKKHYPEYMHDQMFKTFMTDRNALESAFKHREHLLNSSVPGISKSSPNPVKEPVSDEALRSAWLAKSKNPSDAKLRQHYFELVQRKAKSE